jgi:hypothetical protein
MNKYFLVVADFKDRRQDFFDTYMSKRNKEYCELHGYEYIEIKKTNSFRNSGTWLKLFHVRELLESGKVQDGDHITVIDADMCIVDGRYPLWSEKPFTYAIDSCNTHCMGYYSFNICDWSRKLIDNLLNEENYLKHGESDFWRMWAEQSSFYFIAGIQRHSDIPFTQLENCGFGLYPRPETVYEPNELLDNIEIRDVHFNVTYVVSEMDSYLNSLPNADEFYINPNDFDKTIIRHFAGGQPWNHYYFEKPLKK